MDEGKMLTIAFCRNILNEEEEEYTDEEVAEIRDALYVLAELDYLISMKAGIVNEFDPFSEDDKSA